MTDPTAWVGVRGVPDHGTRGRYSRGCRCGTCRAPIREYARRRRAAMPKLPRKVRSDQGLRKVPVVHGTHNGYAGGCRCAPCRAGHAAERRVVTGYERRPELTPEVLEVRLARKRDRLRSRRARMGSVTEATREYAAILDRDPCAYCGAPPTNTVDHIEPVIAGGEHRWENLTAACQHCNSSKGTRSLLTFLAARAA